MKVKAMRVRRKTCMSDVTGDQNIPASASARSVASFLVTQSRRGRRDGVTISSWEKKVNSVKDTYLFDLVLQVEREWKQKANISEPIAKP